MVVFREEGACALCVNARAQRERDHMRAVTAHNRAIRVSEVEGSVDTVQPSRAARRDLVTGLAEEREVDLHRERLARQTGREVSHEVALADWLQHHAATWRRRYQALALRLQREEMMRHKWLVSEREGRDIGSAAILEWVDLYAEEWRNWFDREYHRIAATYSADAN